MAGLIEKFEAVCEEAKAQSSRLSEEQLVELYGLYKQATVGDFSGEETAEDEHAKIKREAWESKKGMSQDDAKVAYVKYAEPLLEKKSE